MPGYHGPMKGGKGGKGGKGKPFGKGGKMMGGKR